MRRSKVYIETSVWNFILADDAPDKKRDTITFFDKARQSGNFELFISELVIEEIEDAPEYIQRILKNKIAEMDPEELEINEGARILAEKYAAAGLVPAKAYRDLVHIAVATVNDLDFIVSWNLAHIVRAKTMSGISSINILNSYHDIRICTILEVR